MDTASGHVARFLEALAVVERRFATIEANLRPRPQVLGTSRLLDPRAIERSGFRLGMYADARLRSHSVVVWSLELRFPEPSWSIEADVSFVENPAEGGQDYLFEYKTRAGTSFDGLLDGLEQAAADLAYSVDAIDYDELESRG